jgi:hypothetical protein
VDPVAQQLATRLSTAFNGGGATSAQPWLWRRLLTLLATGQPVTTDQLATATGRSGEEVRQALAAMPDTEYDQHGHVIGAGLTQRPTPLVAWPHGDSRYCMVWLPSFTSADDLMSAIVPATAINIGTGAYQASGGDQVPARGGPLRH